MRPWLEVPIDGVIFLVYVGYGLALIRSYSEESTLINISLGNWETVQKAEIFAGFMLLLSALVDALISLDINFNKGDMALDILAATHLVILLPLSFAVVVASIDAPTQEDTQVHTAAKPNEEIAINTVMTLERAQQITAMLDKKVRQEYLYLDPELTLSKLTRKLGLPAKQISIAVNVVHKQNISKLINSHRIEHAKHSLICSQSSITQVFMNSGFQTKSNFNREFSRLTGMTPTEYRRNNSEQ
ncbi:helix-turn-helix domain-containing protein [Moritella dasanensis]|uniref:helix-turn-helix domain-containing protein n=1 Tax=Moritella dasanensis TaxID=428031 RepID=UPI0002F54D0F|nr:helix-turn-helix domain-containing protein [Moritella dasanensis]